MKITLARIFIHSICISLLCLYSLASTYSMASEVIEVIEVISYQAQLESRDKAQQFFSKDFYSKLVKTPLFKAARFNSIETLSQAVNSEIKLNNTIKATALIIRNQFLISVIITMLRLYS